MPRIPWTQAMVDAHNARPDLHNPTCKPSLQVDLNPTLKKSLTVARDPVIKDRLTTEKQESPLEALFLNLWTKAGGSPLEREVALIPGRLFRCDFLHRASKTVIEVEGYGIGHFGKAGFKKDADKYYILQVRLGYQVIRFTKSLITEENVREVIAMVTQ